MNISLYNDEIYFIMFHYIKLNYSSEEEKNRDK